jgi:hypothetical protein
MLFPSLLKLLRQEALRHQGLRIMLLELYLSQEVLALLELVQ